jgi:predicted RNase H-like HicB family nuclease
LRVSPVVHLGTTGVLVAQDKILGEKLMRRTFTVVVERDPESGWLVGDVVELSGCYSQAPDLPTLEANMKEAITAYIKATLLEEPLPSFVGTWQVEVTA